MGYTITETIARFNGATYSQIEHPEAFIEVTIPDDAKECIHPEVGDTYYTFNTDIGGGAILVQAYETKPGETATFQLFVREKRIKAGYKFLYCKLVKTDKAANAEAEIVCGAYLADLKKWSNIDQCTLIECPQKKHDGAVVIMPANMELPDVDTLIAKTSKQKWTTVRRQRKVTI